MSHPLCPECGKVLDLFIYDHQKCRANILRKQIADAAKAHADHEGDNGNAALSFEAGAEFGIALNEEKAKDLCKAVHWLIQCKNLSHYAWPVRALEAYLGRSAKGSDIFPEDK